MQSRTIDVEALAERLEAAANFKRGLGSDRIVSKDDLLEAIEILRLAPEYMPPIHTHRELT